MKDERKFWPMPWDDPDKDDAVDTARALRKMSNEERQEKINDFLKKLKHGSNTER